MVRDTAPTGGADFLAQIERVMRESGTGRIATVSGRYHAMDRDHRWDRTQRAYDAIVLGEGRTSTSALSLVTDSYGAGITDEFIEPGVIVDRDGRPIGAVAEGDSAVFFNFRADRARQLTQALGFDDEFGGFRAPSTSERERHDDDRVRRHLRAAGRVHTPGIRLKSGRGARGQRSEQPSDWRRRRSTPT